MCGRFTLSTAPETVAEIFDLEATPRLLPRFNVAPGQDIATIVQDGEGRRALAMRRWGLVPHWARDAKIGGRLINARSETAADKPAFRDAFRQRRCLVPADGFYEWAEVPGGPRQPYHVATAGGSCFAIAGLCERWRTPEGDPLETCVLLTAPSGPWLRPIHDRMPVVLPPDGWEAWLDPGQRDAERLQELLQRPFLQDWVLRPVSRRVNRPEFDDAGCLAPVESGSPA